MKTTLMIKEKKRIMQLIMNKLNWNYNKIKVYKINLWEVLKSKIRLMVNQSMIRIHLNLMKIDFEIYIFKYLSMGLSL